MIMREQVIEKVKVLPKDLLNEVIDFIEFLEAKKKRVKTKSWETLKDSEKLHEADFPDYLGNLTSYEDMLAEGKLKWT